MNIFCSLFAAEFEAAAAPFSVHRGTSARDNETGISPRKGRLVDGWVEPAISKNTRASNWIIFPKGSGGFEKKVVENHHL